MIFSDISISPKTYKMIKNFESSINHSSRDSWIIKITDGDGFSGYGEASPLPSFNEETFEMAGYALEGFKLAVSNISDDFEIEELLILIQAHTDNMPSACFAIETAIYDILSQKKQLPLNLYFNPKALSTLKVNGIYGLIDYNHYNTIKVKCGFRNLYNEIELLDLLTSKYGKDVSFILDINQNYDLPQAIRFLKEIKQFNIAYVEQPLAKGELEDLAELRLHSDIPIAVDESVQGIDSIHNILNHNAADIMVLKPQSLGSFSKVKEAVELIKDENKVPTISCSLEGKIGRFSSMHLSSINQINAPCGLALEKIYLNENNFFPEILNGMISLSTAYGLGHKDS